VLADVPVNLATLVILYDSTSTLVACDKSTFFFPNIEELRKRNLNDAAKMVKIIELPPQKKSRKAFWH